ncbi:hypothetical protein ACN4DY_07625 [Corynebacterium macclintockiae]|uniref:hypothetical protein n=1 Tax=Corynebacterium macclintockiae TaxID=2913501 RepID=UPI003EBCD2CE
MSDDKWTESLDGEEANEREAWGDEPDVDDVEDQDEPDDWDDDQDDRDDTDDGDDWEDSQEFDDEDDGDYEADDEDDDDDWDYDEPDDTDALFYDEDTDALFADADDEEEDDEDEDDREDYDVDNEDDEDEDNPGQESLWDYDENDDEPDNTPDENVDKQVKALRKENAKRRRQLQELRDQSTGIIEQRVGEVIDDIATAAGLGDGADYSEQTLSEALGKRFAEAERRATEAERRLAVTVAANNAGADVDALLDSVSFTNKLDALNPTDEGFTDEVNKLVAGFHQARPTTGATPKKTRGGADFLSGSGAKRTTSNTVEDLAQRRRNRRGVQL